MKHLSLSCSSPFDQENTTHRLAQVFGTNSTVEIKVQPHPNTWLEWRAEGDDPNPGCCPKEAINTRESEKYAHYSFRNQPCLCFDMHP